MSKVAEAASIDDASVDELQASFRGELIRPADAGYDEHRKVWNGSIDRRPEIIARCAGVADVLAAVRFARERGLLTAVRGGGHSFPGLSACDGGIVIDLGPMKGIRVDPGLGRCAPRPGFSSASSIVRRRRSASPFLPGSSPTPGWPGLRSAAASAGSCASTASRSTICCSVDLVTADGEFVKASDNGERRSLLGRAWRRRQLRHRDGVRVPSEPARPPGHGRPDLLADGRGAEGAAVLPRLDRRLSRTSS